MPWWPGVSAGAHSPGSTGWPARQGPCMVALLLVTVVAGQGCEQTVDPPPRIDAAWEQRTIPDHPGAPGRVVVRDAVSCDDRWFVVGAMFLDRPTDTRDTRPAAWVSDDGAKTFEPVEVTADTYWGRRAVLTSVACSRNQIAAVGARSGGAHGNPRVTTFQLDPADRLDDVLAPVTQFGGSSAIDVGPISGGTPGWVIAGNRSSGPAIWYTDDPRAFTLVEGEPGLTRDGDVESLAQAAAWDGEGWVLVGAGASTGEFLDRDPLAWTSQDASTWQPQDVPAQPSSEDVHRVVGVGGGDLLAAGTVGDTFAGWLRTDEVWHQPVRFGRVADDWRRAPQVESLTIHGDAVLATVNDGSGYALWGTLDRGRSWARVPVPVAPGSTGDDTLVVAGRGSGTGPDQHVLLIGDVGDGGRVWMGRLDLGR